MSRRDPRRLIYFLLAQRGGKRSWWGVAQRGVAGRGYQAGIGGFCWRNGAGIGGFCWRNGVGIGGFCWCNGVGNDRGGASRSAGLRDVGGRAGRHRQRGGGKCMAAWGDSGQPLLPYDPWWPHDEPWCAVVAARIPTTRRGGSSHPHLARIGVGAAQNRPQNSRVIRDIGGDAGQPAHQRPATPRCAPHHHDRFPPR
jgi:hypothetical protein